MAFLTQSFNMIRQGTEKTDAFLLPLWRKTAADPGSGIQNTRPGRLGQGGKLDQPVVGHRRFPSGIVQIQKPRRDGLIDRLHPPLLHHGVAAGVKLIVDPFPPRQARRCDLIVQHHRGLGQIVKDRLKPGVEKRQPMLHPGVLAPRTHRLIKRIVGPRRAKLDPVALPKPRDGGIVQNNFGHRCQINGGQLFGGALGDSVKAAQTVQGVAKEIQPDRARVARWPDVNDAAANGIIAGFSHGGDRRKPHAGEKGLQMPLIHPRADPRRKRRPPDHITRGNPLGDRGHGGQQHQGPRQAMRQHRQRGHAPRRDFGIGRDAVIGPTVPSWELQHQQPRRHDAKGSPHRLHAFVVARDMDDGDAPLGLSRQKARVKALGRAAKNDPRRRHALPQNPDLHVLIHAEERGHED